MADIERIKGNLTKMIGANAPKEHIDRYLASEGYNSPEEWRAAVKAPVTADNVVRSLAKGATLGYADRFAAGMDALTGPAIDTGLKALGWGSTNASTKPTLGERYEENLKREQGQTEAFHTAHPYVDTAATIAGGVGGAAATLPAALTRPVAALGPITRLGGNIAKGAAVGGGLGAIAGSSEGDTWGERGQNALTGGTVGAVVGGAAPIVGAVGRAAMETGPGRYVTENVISPTIRKVGEGIGAVKNAFTPSNVSSGARSLSAAAPEGGTSAPLAGLAARTSNVAEEAALQRLATAIQRSGQSPEYWQQQIDKRGAQAVLADLDPQFLDLAVGVKKLPGETKTTATNILEARNRGTGQRLRSAVEGNEPPPTDFALRGEGQAFDQNLRAVGQRAYGLMAETPFKQTPALMEIYQNPHVDQAINRVMAAEKSTRIGTDTPPASPVELMHKVKQAIWDLGFDEATARPGPNASFYRNLGTQFVDRLKAANPELAAADRAYAQAASLPEYYDAGTALFAKGTGERAREASAPALADLLPRSDAQQALAARSGSTNALRSRTDTLRGARAAARDIAESGDIQGKLVQLYGQDRARQIIQQAETEGMFANTSNRLLGGPHTADDLLNAAEVGGNLGLRMRNQNVSAQFIEHLSDIIARVVNPNMAVRNSLGRQLININPSENARYLQRVQEILAQRNRGNAFAGGLAGGGAQSVRE